MSSHSSLVVTRRYLKVSSDADLIYCTRCLKFIKFRLSLSSREIYCACRNENDDDSMRDRPDLMRFYKLVEIDFNDTEELKRLAEEVKAANDVFQAKVKTSSGGITYEKSSSSDMSFGSFGGMKPSVGKMYGGKSAPKKESVAPAPSFMKQEMEAIIKDMKNMGAPLDKKSVVEKTQKAQALKDAYSYPGGVIAPLPQGATQAPGGDGDVDFKVESDETE